VNEIRLHSRWPPAASPAPLPEDAWEQERQLAEIDSLLDRARRWADESPDWLPLARGKALLDRLEPRLRDLRVHLDSVLVVGFVGGTGVGKSTLINALVGEDICDVGKERPTTTRPEILCAPGIDPAFLHLEDCNPRIHERPIPLLENMILLDCPDPDTQPTDQGQTANRNRDILRQVLPHCDVIIHVGSQEKYRSQVIHAELLRHAPGRRIVFVQSRAARDDDVRDHWRATLSESGFEVPEVHRVDAEEALQRKLRGEPVSDEFAELSRLLQRELAGRVRHRIKRANALDLCGWMFGQMLEPIEENMPAVDEALEEIQRQQQHIRTAVRRRLEQQLRENRSRWRSRLMDQVTEKWTAGPFAAVLRLTAGIGGFLRWLPIARARSLTQLAVAGGISGAAAARDWWKQWRGGQTVVSEDLGVSSADVAEARSVLEGYARDAGLSNLIESRTGRLREQFCDETLAELAVRLQARVEAALETATQKRVARKAGAGTHFVFEALYVLLPGYLVFHLGKNFFYDHLWLDRELVGVEFLVHSVLWMTVWTWVFRGMLISRLTRGLKSDALAVVDDAVDDSTLTDFAADIAEAAERVEQHVGALRRLCADLDHLRQELGQLEDVPVGRLAV